MNRSAEHRLGSLAVTDYPLAGALPAAPTAHSPIAIEPREAFGVRACLPPLFVRTPRLRTIEDPRPRQSGAEVTAVQTLARWPVAVEPRAASPVACCPMSLFACPQFAAPVSFI